ncbi:MAG: site-2 protease family protein [Thermoleophilia bacterium]|nr:site-2 protease family protein [Thermoleophilia bacterium]
MRGIHIVRLFGIDISIDPTWLIILFLLVWSLGAGFFPTLYEGWPVAEYWVVAVVAALLLFGSVLVHELAHSLVARRHGTPVGGITLFLFGGVSRIEREADAPGREAVMAVAGPATSAVLGLFFLGLGQLVAGPQTVHALLMYLGVINLVLATFNLLPGFPLDGGRLLRAALWKLRGDMLWATRGATYGGIAVGLGLVALGFVLLLGGDFLGGLWIGFIGWILVQSARSSYDQAVAQHALSRVRAARIMERPKGYLPPDATLRGAVEDYFLELDARCLPVGAEDHVEGLVCLSDLRRRDRGDWGREEVREVMVARDDVAQVDAKASAADALQLMMSRDVNQVAVVENGRVLGFIDRGRLLRYVYLSRGRERGDGEEGASRDAERTSRDTDRGVDKAA